MWLFRPSRPSPPARRSLPLEPASPPKNPRSSLLRCSPFTVVLVPPRFFFLFLAWIHLLPNLLLRPPSLRFLSPASRTSSSPLDPHAPRRPIRFDPCSPTYPLALAPISSILSLLALASELPFHSPVCSTQFILFLSRSLHCQHLHSPSSPPTFPPTHHHLYFIALHE